MLEGRAVLVTGAGSGIGRAIAVRLAAAGAAVAATDLVLAAAEETARLAGGTTFALQLDVTSTESVRGAVEAAHARLGRIDGLVNNAGWDRIEPFLESSPETWDRVIAINLRGLINCCHAVLPHMIESGGGRVVSISSDAGRVGSTGEAVYSACKAGIIGFSKTLAREMARHQINVNVVCPGPTRTPLLEAVTSGDQGERVIQAMVRSVPWRRLGEPEEIAGAVAFFLSDDAGFVTGQVLSVSGGLTMAG